MISNRTDFSRRSTVRRGTNRIEVLIPMLVLLCVLCTSQVGFGQASDFSKQAKASLVFREQNDEKAQYPHLIVVYLRLENQANSELTWVCNQAMDLKADLLDAAGKSVPQAGGAASILSQHHPYRLPYRSRLDWYISGSGFSMFGDVKSNMALVVGSSGWLIPRDSLAGYSLKIRIFGTPFSSDTKERRPSGKLLFDPPAAPIVFEK